MASTVCYNAVSLSTPVFSRTHFPNLTSKDFSLHFSPCFHHFSRWATTTRQKRSFGEVKSTVATAPRESAATAETDRQGKPAEKKLRVLIAGGGIGGLVLALAAKRKGFEVLVFEKDLSAIRGEGQYRGPIQIQSNALAALEAIDLDVADEVLRVGCVTGDRINGLVDGVSGTW